MNPESIAHYHLVAKLGEGGMGAVYRATDTKLNRDVAIKVLPPAFAEDAARMQRFEREAQVLASLNHPNIAAIYGIEQSAIVMELVAGEDLKGPLPVDTVIHYARQIAAGLEAAHEKGIVHRDLKPANIKVTPDGVVKLLDFGLAKAREGSASAATAGTPTMSPTLSLAMTQAGMILGTAAYMSPEQARGKPVDKRADIWAFGVVLYELLTGKMLFGGGETVHDTLASVMKDAPDLGALPAGTPPHIRRLLDRCLRKDAATRLRDIGEARVILDEPAEAGVPVSTARRRAWLPWAVAALALLAAGGAWLRPKPAEVSAGAAHFLIPMPRGTVQTAARAATQWVPSPDGRNLAMIADDAVTGVSALWLRPLGATSPHRLDKTEGAVYPFWSPDSQSIAFFTDGKLKRVSASGGSVQTVCEYSRDDSGRAGPDGGAWNADGVIVFSLTFGPLLRVPAIGGVARPAIPLAKDEIGQRWPQFLPGGRHVMYLSFSPDPAARAIYVQELGSDQRVRVIQSPTRAVWAPPGYLLFLRDGNLMAQPMNLKSFQVSGEPLAVAQDVAANEGNGRSTFAVSQNGVLVYRALTDQMRQLTWRDHEGNVLSEVGKAVDLSGLSLSPDEKSAVYYVGAGGHNDVWVMDLASGASTRLTTDSRAYSLGPSPKWSPDSQRLAFAARGSGVFEITLSSGKIAPLSPEAVVPEAWSPDGKSILCTEPEGRKVYLLRVPQGAKLETILDTPHRKMMFTFSPDGKYVAYVSTESGRQEVYVAAFPSFAVKKKVSDGGGNLPAWIRGGRELLYRSANAHLMSSEIRTGTTIEAGIPKALFAMGSNNARGYRFAPTADGQRILVSGEPKTIVPEVPQISVVLNWLAGVKE